MISRRRLLRSTAALTVAWPSMRLLAATASAPRLVLVVLRGGMDGLAAVPAYGDRDYNKARGNLADPIPGDRSGIRDLDGFFGLHASFNNLHDLYRQKELAIFHAVAPPYKSRSHFDGQDVLEAGIARPSASTDGWLYRALSIVPGGRAPERYAISVGGTVPLVLRGAHPVGAWTPDALPEPDDDTMARVLALYREDPLLGPKLDAALETERMMGSVKPRHGRGFDALDATTSAAAELLRHPDGPRIAVLDSGGWDTHANQQGQLANRFGALDKAVAGFKNGLGDVWSDTVVIMVTEFGRTVAMNGTRGSDHGVGGVAFVAGGAVAGGRVLADWPGLKRSALYQGRDLQPTMDVRSLFKTALVEHLQVDANAVDELVFSDVRVPMLEGMIRKW